MILNSSLRTFVQSDILVHLLSLLGSHSAFICYKLMRLDYLNMDIIIVLQIKIVVFFKKDKVKDSELNKQTN
jgi:hypothetical protein